MNGKQLKNSILQWAIEGRLVPQEPNDEPAIELLRRINPKFTPPQYDEPLPQGWSVATMSMFCSLTNGEKIQGKKMVNLDAKYLRGQQDGKVLTSGKYIPADSLIILVDGENSGEVFRAPTDGYQGSTFKRLVIDANMYEEYILQVINSHRSRLKENKVGSAIPHLNKKLFKELLVLVPPLAEQRRIVERIEELMPLVERYAKAQEGLDKLNGDIRGKLRRSILQEAIEGRLVPQEPNDEPAIELLHRINPKFTPPQYDDTLPQGWSACQYNDIFLNISSRPFQILQSQIQKIGKYPVISQSAKYIEGYSNVDCVLIHNKPYIIFGDHTKVVKYVDFDFVIGADGVKVINPLINEKYAYYLVMCAAIRIEDRGYARHFSQISKYVYLIPPLAEQRRIVERIEELFAVLERIG